MDIDELIVRLERLDIADAVRTALLRNTDKAADTLRDQHKKGQSATGRIGRYRSPLYAQFKYSLNSEAGLGSVDLYLTGSFSEKLRASVTEDELLFNSIDSKTPKLLEKYSASILDLNAENVRNFADDITPDFQRVITQITGLDFA